jgi:hypothetical protein
MDSATTLMTSHHCRYFATRLPLNGLNLTVISLNTNYWSVESNFALRNSSSEACHLGDGMLVWAEGHLAAAEVRCSVFARIFHSRMPLRFTPLLRLKRAYV